MIKKVSEVTGQKWGMRVRTELKEIVMENGYVKDRVLLGVI